MLCGVRRVEAMPEVVELKERKGTMNLISSEKSLLERDLYLSTQV